MSQLRTFVEAETVWIERFTKTTTQMSISIKYRIFFKYFQIVYKKIEHSKIPRIILWKAKKKNTFWAMLLTGLKLEISTVIWFKKDFVKILSRC